MLKRWLALAVFAWACAEPHEPPEGGSGTTPSATTGDGPVEPVLMGVQFNRATFDTTVGEQVEWAVFGVTNAGRSEQIPHGAVEISFQTASIAVRNDTTFEGLGHGSTIVEATWNGFSTTAIVAVEPAPIVDIHFVTSTLPLRLTPLSTTQIAAVAVDREGVERPNVAVSLVATPSSSVTLEGATLFAWEAGDGTVTATAGGISRALPVAVRQPSGLLIQPQNPRIHIDDEVEFHLVAHDQGGEALIHNAPTEWTVDHPALASVSDHGVLHAIDRGRVRVTARTLGESVETVTDIHLAFDRLECGHFECCARARHDQQIYCWGSYRLEASPTVDLSFVPQLALVPELVDFKVGDEFACGLTDEGVVWCWGSNRFGALGDGTVDGRHEARPILSERRFVEVRAGTTAACAISDTRELWCWGAFPPRGWGTVPPSEFLRTTPHRVDAGPIRDLRVNDAACFRREAETSWYCFGHNAHGELGVGSFAPTTEPTEVAAPVEFVDLVTTNRRTCALDQDGQVWCWGDNGSLVLAQPAQMHTSTTPIPIAASQTFDAIPDLRLAIFFCGLTRDTLADAELWCWGGNHWCELGQPNDVIWETTTPVRVELPKDPVAIQAAGHTMLVLRESGDIALIGRAVTGWHPVSRWYNYPPRPVCLPPGRLFDTF